MYSIRCKNCGKEFIAQRSNAKTCSGRCRTALSRRRKQSEGVTPVTLVTSSVTPEPATSVAIAQSATPIFEQLMNLLNAKLDQVNDHLKVICNTGLSTKPNPSVTFEPVVGLPTLDVKESTGGKTKPSDNFLKSIMALQ